MRADSLLPNLPLLGKGIQFVQRRAPCNPEFVPDHLAVRDSEYQPERSQKHLRHSGAGISILLYFLGMLKKAIQMSKGDGDEIPGVGKFIKCHYEVFAIMGIFGTVAVFLSQPNTELAAPFGQFGIFVSLVIFIVAGVWLANESFDSLLSYVGERGLVSEIGYVLIFLSTIMLSGSIGYSLIIEFESLLLFLTPVFLLIIGVLVDIHIYPTSRYKYDDTENSRLPEFAGLFSALIYVYLFDGLLSLIRRLAGEGFLMTVLTVIIFISLAIILHLVASEAFLGLLAMESIVKSVSGKEEIRWRVSLPVMMCLSVGTLYAFTSIITIKDYFYAGPGDLAFVYLQWDEFLVFHWIAITLISGIFLFQGYDWGERKSLDKTLERIATEFDRRALLFEIISIIFILIVIIEIVFIQLGWLHSHGIF